MNNSIQLLFNNRQNKEKKMSRLMQIITLAWIAGSLILLANLPMQIAGLISLGTLITIIIIKKRYRKTHQIKNTDPVPQEVKDEVIKRQQYKCGNCQQGLAGFPVDYHHIVPRHKGGSNNANNIVALCPSCHAKVHRSINQ